MSNNEQRWSPTILPRFDVQLLGRSLVEVSSAGIEVVSKRVMAPDTATIHVPWGIELSTHQVKRGVPLTVALGNDELGQAVVFDGQVSEIKQRNGIAIITAEDLMTCAYETSWTQTWAKGTTVDVVVNDILAGIGLEGSVFNPEGYELAVDFVLNQQLVSEALASLAGRFGLECWMIPGTRTVYFGPSWPYALGLLEQDDLWEINLNSQLVKAHSLIWRDAEEFGSVKIICVDAGFTGEDPVIGRAGEGQPEKVIRLAAKLDIDKANTRAVAELSKLRVQGYEGSLTCQLNPHIRHSQMIRLVGHDAVPESDYPVNEVVYRFNHSVGNEQVLSLAMLVEEGA